MTRRLIKNASWLLTCDDDHRAFRDAYVCVEDGLIAAVGGGEPPWADADEVYDLEGCIVLPGLINLHHHFFQSITRAVPAGQRGDAFSWLMAMYPLWAEYDLDALGAATRASAAELLLTGATTSVDHSNLHWGDTTETADEQIRIVRQMGLRHHFVRGSIPVVEGDLERRLHPIMGERLDHVLGRGLPLIDVIEATLKRHQSRGFGTMTDMSIGPGGVTYGRPDLMRAHARLSREYDCGLHTHYHPRPVERRIAQATAGTSAPRFLADSGWLTERSVFAHCTEIDGEDIQLFADHGCAIAHCPRTILRLGYPVPPFAAMRRAGIGIGVGVDGAASNDSGSMLGELRLALLLHRLDRSPNVDPSADWLGPYDLLLMATRGSADILRRSDIGQLAVGRCGDLAAFRLSGLPYAGAVADPLGALLMAGADTSAELTMVHGRPLVHRGRLLDADEAAIKDGADAAAERVLAGVRARSGLDLARDPKARIAPVFQA